MRKLAGGLLLLVLVGVGCGGSTPTSIPTSTPVAVSSPTASSTPIYAPTPTLTTFFPLPTPTSTLTPTPTYTATPTSTPVVTCTGNMRPYIDCGPSTARYDHALLLHKNLSSQYDSLLDEYNSLQSSFISVELLYERLNAQYMAGGGGVPYDEVAKARIALARAGSEVNLVTVQIGSMAAGRADAWEEVIKYGCEDLGICL